jgi:Peptidase family M48
MSNLTRFSCFLAIVVVGAAYCLSQESPSTIAEPTSKAQSQGDSAQSATTVDQNQNSRRTEPRIRSSPAPAPAASFSEALNRIIEREHFFVAQMRHMHPLVETYIQNLKDDKEMGEVPVSDHYFLGRLDLSEGTSDDSFLNQPGFKTRFVGKLTSLYSMHLVPLGFVQMVLLDSDFQRKYYDFTFVRREFLGEVRCLVIDVQPRKNAGDGRFVGRIWVEDQSYNIVRFNGTYTPHPRFSRYLHFDSWRLNLQPGIWLPAYIYSQESDLKYRGSQTLHFKAQTRLWGYDLPHLAHNEEFAQITVDAPQSVLDQSETGQDSSPTQASRLWQRQAEDNAIDRLQKIGLLAPPGEVDKVLQTVVNNLQVTNNLEIQPEVRCRILLTTPLEAFTIGHTIVISRGMLDVLPDEAALAMVLGHELGHIALGHGFDTKLAFNDRVLFPDDETFDRLGFKHSEEEESAADKKAVQILKNSPYKEKLANAGLFLRALQNRAPELKNLILPHLGDGLVNHKDVRMAELMASAPQLQPRRTDQIAALPLGGRVKLDPWSDRVELLKTKPVPLMSAREKMSFEVTPFFPFLTRLQTNDTHPEKVGFRFHPPSRPTISSAAAITSARFGCDFFGYNCSAKQREPNYVVCPLAC